VKLLPRNYVYAEVRGKLLRMKLRLLLVIFCVIELSILMISFEQRAYAYVDPGSGLLVFQIAGSMIAGVYFMFRRKLRQLFRIKPPVTDNPSHADESAIDKASACDPSR
jgi:hypothetical protein